MPAFQSTAASGTLPIEQTKERTATTGPTSGPQNFAKVSLPEKKNASHHEFGHPGGERAGDEEAADDVLPDRRPIHDEGMADGGEALARAQALPDGAAVDRHVHLGVALHRAKQSAPGLLTRLLDEAPAQKAPEEEREDDDHERPADELSEGELPAEQDRHHDSELDHEVGGRELEHHRRGEVTALAKDGARHRHRRVGTRGGGGAEAAGDLEGTGRVVGEKAAHLGLGDDCLHRSRDGEAEDERPEDFPEHAEGEAEGV
jgi:hypothetical protein